MNLHNEEIKSGCFYFREMRLNKTAIRSYATGSNSHRVIDEDKNKQKYGNKPEIGWICYQFMETNTEVLGMLLNIVKQVNTNPWVHK